MTDPRNRLEIEYALEGFDLAAEKVDELRKEIDELPSFPQTVEGTDTVEHTPKGATLLEELAEAFDFGDCETTGDGPFTHTFKFADLDPAVADEIAAAGATIQLNAMIENNPERKVPEMKKATVQTPSGAIKVPGRYTATETERIRREWERLSAPSVPPLFERMTRFERWSLVFVLILSALFIGAAFLPAAEGEVPAPPFVFELPDFVNWEGKPWAEVFGDGWRLMAATSKTGSLTFLLEAPEGTPAYLEDPVSTKLAPGLNSVPGGRAERRALADLRAAGETRRVLWFYIDGRRFGIDVPLEMWVGDVLWSEVKFSKPPAPSWAGEVCRSRSYVSTLSSTTVIRTEWRCR